MSLSEVEDDPEAYQTSEEEKSKSRSDKKPATRRSARVTKKPSKVLDVDESSDSYSTDSGSEDKPKARNNVSKKRKGSPSPHNSDESSESDGSGTDDESKPRNNSGKKRKSSPSTDNSSTSNTEGKRMPKIVYSNNYAVGSFVVAKKEAKVGDPKKHPWIWRIDGKSLLQKYEPFEQEGKIRHRNTSIYTGWSSMDTDNYAPVTIDLVKQSGGQIVVELHWDELKGIVHEDSE